MFGLIKDTGSDIFSIKCKFFKMCFNKKSSV